MNEQTPQPSTPVQSAPVAAQTTTQQRSGFRTASRVSYILLDILEFFLLVRVGFKLFHANESIAFVRMLYSLTDVFVAPFRQFFSAAGSDDLILEFGTLAAMIFYAVGAYLLVELLLLLQKKGQKQPTG